MLERLSRLAQMLSRRGDMIIALIVMVAIVMMIVPLPTAVVDIFITINISASLLILMVSFYLISPTQFSSLPSVILIVTLFRIAITISTTRLILLQADAGEVVGAFGDFVIGGNVAVGLVIFFIITVAQFVVITKGGERVAEVAARFTLDALPGKQMSIDNELRNGDINQAEARTMRKALERESHLYGAMDGAMKFVKGDSIAGLIIILVNLIGGIAVGMTQHGLPFGQAVQTFSLLTVGDGLVSQIPALLVSVAAGVVVTRVAAEEKSDLGTDIASQLMSDERALYLAGGILVGMAFIPGFPTYVFLTFGVGFTIAGYIMQKRRAAQLQQDEDDDFAPTSGVAVRADRPAGEAAPVVEELAPPAHAIVVWVGPTLATAIPKKAFSEQAATVRNKLIDDLGIDIPPIELRTDQRTEAHHFHINLEDVPVAEGDVFADRLLVDDEIVHLKLLNIPYETGAPLIGRQEAIWVDKSHYPELNNAGVQFLSPTQTLGKCLAQMLRRYATQFVGIQETRALLAKAEAEYGDLVAEAAKVANLQKIAEILRRLIEENVPIRNMRLILEALVEWGPREPDVVLLGEYVRMALGRQICYRVADDNRVIAAYVLERSVEEMLRAAIRPTNVGTFLSLSEEAARPIIEQFEQLLSSTNADVQPAVLATMDVRRHVRNLLMRNDIDIPVLSYQELAPEFSVQPLATVVREGAAGRIKSTSGQHGEPRAVSQPAG